MIVDVVTAVHPVVAVNHPLKVYPVREGLVGRVQTAVLYGMSLLAGQCPDPPFPSNVTV